MTIPSSFALSILAILAGLSAAALPAGAQDFPARPIRFIVPFPPGGSGDTLARVLGQKLGEQVGQQVIIENRPGGNTIIATEIVAKSPPDGYTLTPAVDSGLTMNPHAYQRLPYKVEDLTAVAMLAEQSLLLSVNPQKMPARTFQEFVAYTKANPGKVNLGIGALVSHVATEQIKASTGMDVVIVPFKGGAESINAILAGTVESSVSDITAYVPHIRAGRIHGIAVTRARRTASLPEVPTVAELGFPQVDVRSWYGLMGPGGIPRPVVNRLNQEVNRALNAADVKARLLAVGLEAIPGTPEELAEVIRADSAKWAPVIRRAGIKLD